MDPTNLLEELIDNGEKHARRVLLVRGEESLTPLYHLVNAEGEGAIVGVEFHSEAQKQIIVEKVREIAADFGAVAVLLMSEGWAVSYSLDVDKDDPVALGPSPSNHPRRIEVVSLAATDGKRTIGRMLFIKRIGGRIEALERRDPDTVENTVVEFGLADVLPRRTEH